MKLKWDKTKQNKNKVKHIKVRNDKKKRQNKNQLTHLTPGVSEL